MAPTNSKKKIDGALTRIWDIERDHCAADPCHFAFNHVLTKDEHDFENPVRKFPEKEYLRFTLNEWHTGEKLQYVAKSRQLMVSWLLCVYAIWVARFVPHRLVLFQSKKSEDAQKMVFVQSPEQARCSFLEHNLPGWLKYAKMSDGSYAPIKMKDVGREGTLVYPNGSRIEAIPQGSTQIEGRVPSLYLCDEASLQDEWSAAQAAAKPCIAGAARGITVATMRLPSDYGDEIAPSDDVDPDSEMRGIARFTSKSGVSGIRIHYTADPAKDPETPQGAVWLSQALAGYPGGMAGHQWQQHMEINPLARSGTRCIHMWDEVKDQVVIPDLTIERQIGGRHYAGLDWGARNNAVWLVFWASREGRLYLVHELATPGNKVGGIEGFARLMKKSPYLDRVNGRIWADPTIWNKDQNVTGGLVSKAKVFRANGIRLKPAKMKGQEADELFLDRLLYHHWGEWEADDFDPTFLICQNARSTIHRWPMLRYEEWSAHLAGERSLKEVMKDRWTDEFDAAKYFLCSEFPRSPEIKLPPPPRSYRAFVNRIDAMKRAERRRRS